MCFIVIISTGCMSFLIPTGFRTHPLDFLFPFHFLLKVTLRCKEIIFLQIPRELKLLKIKRKTGGEKINRRMLHQTVPLKQPIRRSVPPFFFLFLLLLLSFQELMKQTRISLNLLRATVLSCFLGVKLLEVCTS